MAMTSKNPKTKNIKTQYDDLTVIDGIGQARQKWLREIFNIHTFADFAALSPDTIEAQLKAEKKIVSHAEIVEWITQAKKHAADVARTPKSELSSPKENWGTAATFVVVFEEQQDVTGQPLRRATIHRIEADETQTKVEQAELYNWMRTWFGEPPTPTITEVKATPEPLPAPTMPPMFTPKLAQMIAKTQALEGKPQPHTVTSSAEGGQTAPNPTASPVSQSKDSAFSPKMQEMIAKIQALEKRKH